ncbi:MAG TPA: ABC transporter substrate-binding protein, partial [Acidobacteriota bacterium]
KFRFYLREGVRFHDGRRLTARDVRYSFEHLLQNKETQYRWLLSPIRGAKEILNGTVRELAGFKIVSALEFVVELDQPLSFFPALLAYTATSIIPEGTEKFHGSWREGCAGTGPFRAISFDPGRSLKVEANPDYWRAGYPKLEYIEFSFGLSPAESLAGFKSGRYSLAMDLVPADVEALLHEPEYASNFSEIPNLITYYVVMNIHLDPLQDERIRHQLIDSLNVASLTRRNIGRLAVPANSLTPSGLLGYEPAPRIIAPAPAKKSGASEMELSAMLHSIYQSRYTGFTRDLFQNMADRGFPINIVETKGEFLPASAYPAVHLNLTRWVADYPDADTFMYYLLHSQNGVEGFFCGNADLDRLLEK